MKEDYVLVVDSGEGGAYTLSKIRAVLPNENFILFKDKKHSPYGNKSPKKLEKIAFQNIEMLIKKYKIKLIVLACNTLSAVVFEKLTAKFKNYIMMPIIPDIENAIITKKPTLVLSTFVTNKHSRVCNLYRQKNIKNLYFLGFKTLAKKIDKNISNLKNILPILKKKLKKFESKNIENIVLGCTHFNWIKEELKAVFKRDIVFFENSEVLAQNINSVLVSFGIKNEKPDGNLIVLENN